MPQRIPNFFFSHFLSTQIKREPCQVSEITTSNTLAQHYQQQQQQQLQQSTQTQQQTNQNNVDRQQVTAPTVLKIETAALKRSIATTNNILAVGPSTIDMDHHSNTTHSQANAIPVGIAVARQRLQEHAQQQHAVKDLNRYGIGISSNDLGKFFYQIFYHS